MIEFPLPGEVRLGVSVDAAGCIMVKIAAAIMVLVVETIAGESEVGRRVRMIPFPGDGVLVARCLHIRIRQIHRGGGLVDS